METAIASRHRRNYVNFTLNGIPHVVSEDIPYDTSLNVYIRDYAKFRGTKAMCHEGGCGACIVAAEIKGKTMAVNSCLVPILICDGWVISTIEGLGNRADGYHTIQATLAENNGSQCGYCSPGMVMNLYSLIRDKKLSMQQIENSFGGNICRCTGYRSILDAFKRFASDATPSMMKNIHDIEELYKIKACPKYGMPCTGSCSNKQFFDGKTMLDIKLADAEFNKVYTIDDLFAIFQHNPHATYILNGGNTAHGVYRSGVKDLYIDINDIPDLHYIHKANEFLVLGGNTTLTVALETFQKYSTKPGFKYLRSLAKHIDLVANVPVRNIGTIAGNLMIKHTHSEFPSDIFLILETTGTQLHILEGSGRKQSVSLLEFLTIDMHHKIIYSVILPPISDDYEHRSYKIMPRAQNAHAHVNAGFLFKLGSRGTVLERPNIIYGGIDKYFYHATHTELMLIGKVILDNQVLKAALKTLHDELKPDHVLPDYSPEFRRTLAEGLFYKFVLSIKPENVNPRFRSGGTLLERGLSSGTQDYETDKNVWPVNKPIPKLDAINQTSGEAEYCNDLPPYPREVFCAFVLSKVGNGKIDGIDASEALRIKGVVAFFSAKDIPGKNLCISAASKLLFLIEDELLFAENDILYAGQPVGVIVAETHNLANEAAKLVEIRYSEYLNTKPIISIEDALATQDDRIMQSIDMPAKEKGKNTKQVIKGIFQCGHQYHFTMEPQSCVCVPVEDGMNVYPTSQWMDLIQVSIANCLNVKNNSINVYVRRVGGAYGAKISRNVQISCTCALVCHKLNRPARFVMTIESNMQSIGKRYSTRQEYEIGVDNDGVIQYLNAKHWGNCGCNFNEPQAARVVSYMQGGCYATDSWTFEGFEVRTDIPSNTHCRAPASMEAIAMMENLMEHIAKATKKDPIQIRLSNMNEVDKKVLETMIKDLSKSGDYEMRKRAVETFNKQNRWKKKGIAVVTMKYPILYSGQFNAMVSICARDGSVCVTHGGIEVGQGINTKIAQITARTLGIDLELISVKQSNNLAAPNNSLTGGNITTETCGYATIQACNEILKRLEPIRKEMNNPSWKDLVFTAYQADVDLCARYMLASAQNDTIRPYGIYGVTIAEVEIDILTGQHIIRRVDIMEDAGVSLNPKLDVGQVEGAFVMGIGYWTSEDLVYDPKTGVLTNDRTWNYKPPGAKDIPEDFRVSLRKNSANTVGIFGSKTTGEPPLCMSCVIPIAIRNALNSARAETGNKDEWYRLDGPCTTERILLTSLTRNEDMVL